MAASLPSPAAFGPGNWPLPATLVGLSATHRARYANLHAVVTLIEKINRTVPGYTSDDQVGYTRWQAMLPLWNAQSPDGTACTSHHSLRSRYSKAKTELRGLITRNTNATVGGIALAGGPSPQTRQVSAVAPANVPAQARTPLPNGRMEVPYWAELARIYDDGDDEEDADSSDEEEIERSGRACLDVFGFSSS